MVPEATLVWIQLGVELPFVLFHVTVLICVLRSVHQRQPYFATAFFRIYALQSAVELWSYASLMVGSRFARAGYTTAFLSSSQPLWNFLSVSFRYCVFVQFGAHVAMAVNRYQVIANPVLNMKAKLSRRTIAAVFLLPMLGSVFCLLAKIVAVPTATPNLYVVTYDPPWVIPAMTISFTLFSVPTAMTSLYFELRTLVAYQRLHIALRRNKHQDFRLLLYALTQLVGQFLIAAYYTLHCVTGLLGAPGLMQIPQLLYIYVIDLICLSSPVCLMITSTVLRRRYLSFYRLRKDTDDLTPVTSIDGLSLRRS